MRAAYLISSLYSKFFSPGKRGLWESEDFLIPREALQDLGKTVGYETELMLASPCVSPKSILD
jgi:hypothetical protein